MKIFKVSKSRGFSLAEAVVALTVSAMILVAIIDIYNRTQKTANAITRKIGENRLPREILQRITEDIDNIVGGSDTTITIENKTESHGFQTARLTITKNIYDDKNAQQTFEKIIWQANYDFDSPYPGLVLYRSRSGLNLEDKLLDEEKEKWQTELFIPVCSGLTMFKVQVLKEVKMETQPQEQLPGQLLQNELLATEQPEPELIDSWASSTLPKALVVTISFVEPFKSSAGVLDVFEDEKVVRTIAVDRSRTIKFAILEQADDGSYVEPNDSEVEEVNDVNE